MTRLASENARVLWLVSHMWLLLRSSLCAHTRVPPHTHTQQEVVETKDETCKDILFKIHLKLSEMDALYEMSGKNIDEDS